jgi:Domain of Unknown Function (DUF1080)
MLLQTMTRVRRVALLTAVTSSTVACTEGDRSKPQLVATSLASSAPTAPSSASIEPAGSLGGNSTSTAVAPQPSAAAFSATASVGTGPISGTESPASSSGGAPEASANPTQIATGADAGEAAAEASGDAGALATTSATASSTPPNDGRGPRAPQTGDMQVLFDGSGFEAWVPADTTVGAVNWVLNADEGTMQVAPTYTNHIVTSPAHLHRDVFLHVEFWSPNESSNQMGQDRGNSGIYLQSRYEVQVLDSFGRGPELDGCGAIYKVSAPLVNACKPAEQWNVYEIDFTAPRFTSGQKVASARLTVWLNEQLVQDDVEVPGPTQAGEPDETDAAEPLYLQDHGDAVRYRNIWWIPR